MPDKMVLRVVGGPHDGATYDATPDTVIVQMALKVELPMAGGHDDPTDTVPYVAKVATYRRRVMHCEDGRDVHFLCYNGWSDRQALCHLLRVPYET